MDGAPLIEVRGVSKRFGATNALREVSLSISRGSVHGLVGENGAGKSTLGKIITGVYRPDDGELAVDGRVVSYRSPHDAQSDGLVLIAQELALVPRRSVVENIFLGAESSRAGFVRRRELLARYRNLDTLGFSLDPEVPAGSLRLADQQKVEILRAIARDARLIVMDEPTASLGRDDSERLFAIVRALAERGTTMVFISHSLQDVLALCETVTVLKDGRQVRTAAAKDETTEKLVLAMIGRSLELIFPEKTPPAVDAPAVLSVRHLSSGNRVSDVSFEVRRGEIVGLAGLIGSGRSEVARAIFGADRRSGGTIELAGRPVQIRSPRQAVKLGVALLPESRKDLGLVMGRSICDNVALPYLEGLSTAGFVRAGEERRSAHDAIQRLEVPIARINEPVARLSGGNQQRVLFAKWLYRRPRVLIADEPTRGVDVGAKRAIYTLLAALAAEGLAILLISSELEEVLGLSHRVLVMRAGTIAAELHAEAASPESILRAAFGTADFITTAA